MRGENIRENLSTDMFSVMIFSAGRAVLYIIFSSVVTPGIRIHPFRYITSSSLNAIFLLLIDVGY
jgi:hypothetical protein